MAVLFQALEIPSSLKSNLIKINLKNFPAVSCLFFLPKKNNSSQKHTTDHFLKITTAVITVGWLSQILFIFYIPKKKPDIDMGWTQTIGHDSDFTDAWLRKT